MNPTRPDYDSFIKAGFMPGTLKPKPPAKAEHQPNGFEDYDLTKDEEFLELVRVWHRLQPSIKGAIVILAQRGAAR